MFRVVVFVRSTVLPVKVFFKRTASLPCSSKNRVQNIGIREKEPPWSL